MSRLTEGLNRLKSLVGLVDVWDEVKGKVKEEAPDVFEVLDALARDDHQAAARALLSSGSVVDAVAEVLKKVDDALPEETIIRLMEKTGLPRAT